MMAMMCNSMVREWLLDCGGLGLSGAVTLQSNPHICGVPADGCLWIDRHV